MKIVLRLMGLLGFLLFGTGFAVTFLSPIHFERAGKAFIQAQVEAKVRDTIDDLRHPTLERAAGFLANRYEREIAEIREQLKDGLPEKIATVVAQMQDLSCECRQKLAGDIRQSFEWRIAALSQAQPQLMALIQGKYVEIVQKLLLDLRIFTGTNATVFLMLLVVSLVKARAAAHLYLPATLLMLATLISAYFYLFQQNWFFTIIHNSYLGFGYAAYLSVVFLFLCDVVLNQARVTTGILNAIFEAIGSATVLDPC
jgi:hypothetical protein